MTGFVLPLAVSTFKIAAPVSWTVGALFVAWFYGIHLGARELATIAVAAIFLPFIGPGVPRGAFLMLAPLFLAIGLPAEGIGILIAVDAIPGRVQHGAQRDGGSRGGGDHPARRELAQRSGGRAGAVSIRGAFASARPDRHQTFGRLLCGARG